MRLKQAVIMLRVYCLIAFHPNSIIVRQPREAHDKADILGYLGLGVNK